MLTSSVMRLWWFLFLVTVLAGAEKLDLDAIVRSAASLTTAMGEENLKKGIAYAGEGPDFLFAVESEAKPVLFVDEQPATAMRQVAKLWYATATLKTGATHSFYYEIDGKHFGGRTDVVAFGPLSYERPGVPKGTLHGKFVHTSRIYPGMKSDYWVYVPAQYDAKTPAALMVWQDGEVLVQRGMPSRAQTVFDNLTHDKRIPVIIQVLISPGMIDERRLRSIEYDTVSDAYARFLRDEILAEVSQKWNIRKDGYSRAIAGDSSGGICSFNVAWFQPDQFSRVLSRIGSFTSIQWHPGEIDGGNIYPFRIRKEARRNIRVWLQDGANDLENDHGSWPFQNLQMANSLKMKGYDFHLSFGSGTHNRNGGHAELPEEMIWLWRDYDAAKTTQQYEMEPAELDKPLFRIKALNRE